MVDEDESEAHRATSPLRNPRVWKYLVRGSSSVTQGPFTLAELAPLYAARKIDDASEIAEYLGAGSSKSFVLLLERPDLLDHLRPARLEADKAQIAQAEERARPQREEQDRQAKLNVGPRQWYYSMLQIPRHIEVREGSPTGGVAAQYLAKIVEEQVARGWVFYRVDEVGVQINPGCLGALFGARPTLERYFVVTFRRVAGAESHRPDLPNRSHDA